MRRGGSVVLGFGLRHFQDLGPHLVLPAGIAGDSEDNLAVLGQDEAWRRLGPRLALVALQEGSAGPERILGPAVILQDQRQVGWMDDPVVEFLAGVGFDEVRLRLGTPDLAAASKFVTDEHQHRLPRLGLRDAGQ